MSTTASEANFTPANEISNLYTQFNKALLTILLNLKLTDSALPDELATSLANSIGRTPAFITKLHSAVSILAHMPTLRNRLLDSGDFDVDRLAALGGQIANFEELAPEEIEKVVLSLLSTTPTCPSPSRLSKAIKEGDYKQSQRKPATAHPRKVAPATQKEVSTVDSRGNSALVIPCSPETASLAKRIIEDQAQKKACSFVDALMSILTGGRQPRITIHAIELPNGKSYVEGKGWIETEDLALMSPHLHHRRIVDQTKMTQIFERFLPKEET